VSWWAGVSGRFPHTYDFRMILLCVYLLMVSEVQLLAVLLTMTVQRSPLLCES
jgi:hypothetical protein